MLQTTDSQKRSLRTKVANDLMTVQITPEMQQLANRDTNFAKLLSITQNQKSLIGNMANLPVVDKGGAGLIVKPQVANAAQFPEGITLNFDATVDLVGAPIKVIFLDGTGIGKSFFNFANGNGDDYLGTNSFILPSSTGGAGAAFQQANVSIGNQQRIKMIIGFKGDSNFGNVNFQLFRMKKNSDIDYLRTLNFNTALRSWNFDTQVLTWDFSNEVQPLIWDALTGIIVNNNGDTDFGITIVLDGTDSVSSYAS